MLRLPGRNGLHSLVLGASITMVKIRSRATDALKPRVLVIDIIWSLFVLTCKMGVIALSIGFFERPTLCMRELLLKLCCC